MMARSMTAEKTPITFTGYQTPTGMNSRTASATPTRATRAMLAVQVTLARRWLEPDTDRDCIEHPRCAQTMELRHSLGGRIVADYSARSGFSQVVASSGRSHPRPPTSWCDFEALGDTITSARPDLAARCHRLRYPRPSRAKNSRANPSHYI